jgi:hypothetical protein
MTCIVGVSDGSTVIIGADSALTCSGETYTISDPKVWTVGGWAFGASGEWRSICILREELVKGDLPEPGSVYELYQLCSELTPKRGDWTMVVGGAGRIWNLSCDDGWHNGRTVNSRIENPRRLSYMTSGSGEAHAIGNLRANFSRDDLSLNEIVLRALRVSAENCGGVKPPFKLVSVTT